MGNCAVSTPLHRALSNAEDLKIFLQQDASSVNVLDCDGDAPLHRVLKDPECSVDVIALLLNYGANINLVNIYGFSPLSVALIKCTEEVIELLLNKGADISKTCSETPLQLAFWSQRSQRQIKCILKLLLDHGTDVNRVNDRGQTPLCTAFKCHNVDIIELLLGAGAHMSGCEYHVSAFHCYVDNIDSLKVDVLKLLLNQGTNVNTVDDRGQTPLCIVLQKHDEVEVVKLLLNAGADTNGCENHVSSFHCYLDKAGSLNVHVLKLLLNKCTDVNKANAPGQTPMCIALQKYDVDIVKLLLDSGAHVNGCERHVSSLHCYLFNFDSLKIDVLQLLLNQGIDVNKVNASGYTPLCLALKKHAGVDVLQLLLDSDAHVNGCENHSSSLHCYMDTFDDIEVNVLKLLLDKGSDMKKINKRGETPLCIALQRQKVDVIKLLLDAGGHVRGCRRHVSFLHCYLETYNNLETIVLNLLLDKDNDVNKVNRHGQTPLCIALKKSKVYVIEFLLNAGAHVNGCKNHDSSLHCYMANFNPLEVDVLKLLQSKGSDFNKVNSNGQTPLCIALSKPRINDIKNLLDTGADINGCKCHVSSFHCYVSQSDFLKVGILKLIMRADADIHKVDDSGNTPLLLALKNCDCEISAIKFLLNHKDGDINVINKFGETALHCAVQNDRCVKISIIKFLILQGAQIDATSKNGNIPLHYAVKNNKCQPNIIRTLVNKGSVNLKNKSGLTPLRSIAFGDYYYDVLKILLVAGARIQRVGERFTIKEVEHIYKNTQFEQNLRCLQLFLKYCFLERPSLLHNNFLIQFPIPHFISNCMLELQCMKSEFVGPNLTLHEFLRTPMDANEFKQKAEDYNFNQLLKILVKNKFSMYLEVVLARVGTSCLIDKLEMPIYTEVSNPDFSCIKRKVILDYSSACNIAHYLSDNDLLNLILAFHKLPSTSAFGGSKKSGLVSKRKRVKSIS